MKILPVVAELSEAYGRTDTDRHDEADSRISQFCKRASKWNFYPVFSLVITKVDSLHFPSFRGSAVLLPLSRKLWETSEVSPVTDR
jgi:hypothetical protein